MSTGRAPQRTARDERLMREQRRARAAERERARLSAEEIEDREAAVRRAADERAVEEERAARATPPRRRAGASSARTPRARRGSSELLSRVLVAVPLAFVAIIFVDVGGLAWALLMAVMSALCLVELYRMLERWAPVGLVGCGIAVAMVLVARYGTPVDVLEVAMAAIPITFLAVTLRGGDGIPTVSIAGTLLGVFWVGLGFAHATLLRELPHGNGIVIDVMLGTFLADVGAYFGGRLFGHTPLAPAISPNKTVEGLGLGMFTAVVVVFVAGRFQQAWLSEGDALVLGITIAVLGPLGDLFESLVKRDAGAKDAGTLFGAHGGALDRLDAVIFTAVGSYYVWSALLH